MRFLLLFLLTGSLSLNSCRQALLEEKVLYGNWEATWEYAGEQIPVQQQDSICHLIHGRINFNQEGLADFRSFGHANCIFPADTTKHILKWEIRENQLYIATQTNSQHTPYFIKSSRRDHLEFEHSGIRLIMDRL